MLQWQSWRRMNFADHCWSSSYCEHHVCQVCINLPTEVACIVTFENTEIVLSVFFHNVEFYDQCMSIWLHVWMLHSLHTCYEEYNIITCQISWSKRVSKIQVIFICECLCFCRVLGWTCALLVVPTITHRLGGPNVASWTSKSTAFLFISMWPVIVFSASSTYWKKTIRSSVIYEFPSTHFYS